MSSSQPYSRWKVIAVGAAVGAAYGLFIRASIQVNLSRSVLGVISVAFLLVTPFAMGFLTTFYIERRRAQSIWMWLVLGWIPVLASTMGMFIVAWEGLICIAMYLPIGLSCATIGGLLGGYTARVLQRSAIKNLPMACVAVLPLLVAPWEERAFLHRDLHTVESVITIHAPAETVWRNIERVRAIRPEELTPSWTRALGFPAPIEATLICPGEPETFVGDPKQCAGGVRHATFAGGVLFIENIDVWQPMERLEFSIHAQTEQIPRTTLDEHVTVGGPFFDVLRGEYRLEPVNGGTRLHLTSRHRLSTSFNRYASLWIDAVMGDIQQTILKVIQQRCEK